MSVDPAAIQQPAQGDLGYGVGRGAPSADLSAALNRGGSPYLQPGAFGPGAYPHPGGNTGLGSYPSHESGPVAHQPGMAGGGFHPGVHGNPGDGTSGGLATHPGGGFHPLISQLMPYIQQYWGQHPEAQAWVTHLLTMLHGPAGGIHPVPPTPGGPMLPGGPTPPAPQHLPPVTGWEKQYPDAQRLYPQPYRARYG